MKILVILSFLMVGGVGEVVGIPLAEPLPQAAAAGPAVLKQLPSNPLGIPFPAPTLPNHYPDSLLTKAP